MLVPDEGADGIELARKVWALATPCELPVVLLYLLGAGSDSGRDSRSRDEASREPSARLRLATLAAQVRDDHIHVETHVIPSQGWVGAIRQLCQPGDLVLCCAEQTVPIVSSGRQPLHQVLSFMLDVPVFVLTGVYSEPRARDNRSPKQFSRAAFWSVVVAIVVVFFFVQVQVDQQMVGLARTLLLLCSALVELGVIAIWNAIA